MNMFISNRLVREYLKDMTGIDYKVQSSALLALQISAEQYLINFLQDAYCCTLHGNRVTLKPKDMHLVKFVKRNLEQMKTTS